VSVLIVVTLRRDLSSATEIPTKASAALTVALSPSKWSFRRNERSPYLVGAVRQPRSLGLSESQIVGLIA
jgi:hypothetical protein